MYNSNRLRQGENIDRDSDCLDSVILPSEIREGIRSLGTGKSPGPDDIVGEMLKCSTDFVLPIISKLFNAILECGNFPQIWSKGIIIPLHKKGNFSEPDNYRGITLTSVFSKVFLHIVNNRLQKFIENNDIIVEEQSGFRKGYSTIDNIFVLHGIIEKYLSRSRKLYLAFVDFRKAFDSVNRRALWAIMDKYGFRGKIVDILKSMYHNVTCCVRSGNVLSEYFECSNGLKQGCKCSATLFSIMINMLAIEVKEKCKHGIQLIPNTEEIPLLLFCR